MLYRTHQGPFFFPLNPFTTTPILSPSPTTTTTPHPLLPPPPPPTPTPQIQGMDCGVEGALKSSFLPEAGAGKKTPQQHPHPQPQPQPPLFDDSSAVNGNSCDDFFVDDLLDFSEGGVEDGFCEEEEQKQEEKEPKKSEEEEGEVKGPHDHNRSDLSLVVDDFPSVPCAAELIVPEDDLADLEWLSNFVDDSFSNYSLAYPAGKLPEKKPIDQRSQPAEIPAPTTKSCFATPVQTKARSKRSRTGFRVWSRDSLSLTDSSSTSSSSSSTTTQTADSVLGPPPSLPPPAKKQRKKKLGGSGGGSGGGSTQQPRRCSHCLVQKTPQWRAGPLGAKTLCNACGVRFKSGRLLPEYRPACSPTFSSEVHSNNHRKVLEMRRKKEGEANLAPPVQSF